MWKKDNILLHPSRFWQLKGTKVWSWNNRAETVYVAGEVIWHQGWDIRVQIMWRQDKVKDRHLLNTTLSVACVIHVSSQFRRRFCSVFYFRWLLLLLVLCEGHSSRMLNICMSDRVAAPKQTRIAMKFNVCCWRSKMAKLHEERGKIWFLSNIFTCSLRQSARLMQGSPWYLYVSV